MHSRCGSNGAKSGQISLRLENKIVHTAQLDGTVDKSSFPPAMTDVARARRVAILKNRIVVDPGVGGRQDGLDDKWICSILWQAEVCGRCEIR